MEHLPHFKSTRREIAILYSKAPLQEYKVLAAFILVLHVMQIVVSSLAVKECKIMIVKTCTLFQ